MAPLTRGRTDLKEGVPTAATVQYYVQRATAGLIISEATHISKQAHGWGGAPGLWTAEQVTGWQAVTSGVHAAGGKIFSQLWHMGRQAHSQFWGLHPISASAIAAQGETQINGSLKATYEVPRAVETAEVPAIVAEYKTAAEHAKAAGFDGIEVHGYVRDSILDAL